MRFIIKGSSGFIGSELVPCLIERGHEVIRLVRHDSELSDDIVLWDPQHCELRLEDFEGFDCVINLSGENIATGRWTENKKKKIRDSRVMGTHMLCELLARLDKPPKVLINSSAIGYYGDQGDRVVREDSPPGKGFLADVCRDWEKATEPAKKKGIRVVNLRTGVVLAPNGGALGKMLTPFKLGLGGVIGSGEQYISWVSMDDMIGIFLHIVGNETIEGPVNAVAPNPVTNQEFTKTLGKILRRPTVVPLPAFMAKSLFGEMAEETMLSSTRVAPDMLTISGYSFLYPSLKGALEHMLD